MERTKVDWQYCKNPNEINRAIEEHDYNWYSLKSADQIINIIWVQEQHLYQVFWRVPDDLDTDIAVHYAEAFDDDLQ